MSSFVVDDVIEIRSGCVDYRAQLKHLQMNHFGLIVQKYNELLT